MADYVVEPIKRERPLADIISEAVDAGLSDAEIKAAVAKRKAAAPKTGPAVGEYTSGPLSQQELARGGRRGQDPLAGGDVDLKGGGFAYTYPQLANEYGIVGAPGGTATNGPEEARGFLRFAGSGLAGMAASGAARALGAGPGTQGVVGGIASGAAPSAMAGERPEEILKNAAIGAAIPTVGSLLSGAGKAIMASRGAKARALIEKHGGNVGVADSGSGLPEFEGRGKITDADIGEQARESGRKLLDVNEQTFDKEGRQPYKAATAQIDKGQGRNLVDVLPLRRKMIEVASAPDTDPAVRSVLLGQVKEMDAAFPDTGMGKRFAPESWVNGKTSWLWKQANPDRLGSGGGTPRDAKFGEVAAVGQQIREQGPYAEANANYRTAKQESGDFREALGAKRTPNIDETVDERKIGNFLARRGQTTTTAGIQGGDKRLAELIAKHPDLERTIDSPELLRAKADLQFRLKGPEHGGLIDRVGGPVAGTLAAVGAAVAGHGGWGAAAAIPAYLIGQNVNPIAGRLLHNPARGAMAAGGAMTSRPDLAMQFAQMQASIAEKRRRDAAAIHAIFGGGEQKRAEVP